MKIGILVNNKLALPALELLLKHKFLVGIGVSALAGETRDHITYFASHNHVPLSVFHKADLEVRLLEWIDETGAELVLVLTFPFLIPKPVLQYPLYGFYNFHFGLLPHYRGADPVFWQIRNREHEGGISIHKMDSGIDTGPLVLLQKIPILPEDTYGMHLTKLAYATVDVMGLFLQTIQSNRVQFHEQDESLARYHTRPVLQDLLINWEKQNASEVMAIVKAGNPWNKGAITMINGWTIRIADVSLSGSGTKDVLPGTIVRADAVNGLLVTCADKQLLRLEVIATDEGFFAGERITQFGLKPGQRFTSQQESLVPA